MTSNVEPYIFDASTYAVFALTCFLIFPVFSPVPQNAKERVNSSSSLHSVEGPHPSYPQFVCALVLFWFSLFAVLNNSLVKCFSLQGIPRNLHHFLWLKMQQYILPMGKHASSSIGKDSLSQQLASISGVSEMS